MSARLNSPLRALNKLGGVVIYGAIGGILGSISGFVLAILFTSAIGSASRHMASFIPVMTGVIAAIAAVYGYLASTRSPE